MKNKKIKLGIAAALVVVIGVGGTLAYMSTRTDEVTNTFTIGKGIEGSIEEPSWDPDQKGEVEYTPGGTIPKDPQILNTSTDEAAYLGIRLTYTWDEEKVIAALSEKKDADGNSLYANPQTAISEFLAAQSCSTVEEYIKKITTETTYNITEDAITAEAPQVDGHWVALNGTDNSYIYVGGDNSVLSVAAGSQSEPLFEEIKIIAKVANETQFGFNDMVPFEINAQGYLLQSKDNTTNIESQMVALIEANK